ncbi:hypothetical protein C8F01DRAFT_1181627 [Mycena amicta]|nr:hypothetical protein C8F01DRAFT_1181627 [Mycena amicta]
MSTQDAQDRSPSQEAESSKAGAASNSRKLKCDKKIPCGSCVRRGCSAICPTVLSEVPELTARISEMGERIRQLEQAVASTHDSAGSSSHHPLLEHAPPTRPPTPPTQNAEDGSLSVDQAGHAVYFGPSAGTEIEGDSPDHQRLSFAAVTESFPFRTDRTANWDVDSALEQLYLHLPLQPRAWALCERYFQNGCWTCMPMMQDEAVEILARVYQRSSASDISTQQMAVVYFVFALGALVDLDLPAYSSEADHYFDLGCAAMAVTPFYDNPSVLTVQMLTLLASYLAHGGRRFSMDGAWSVISLSSCIAQRVNRESFGANLGPKLAYRYRALFWETYSTEIIYGLSVGRPPGTLSSNISCPFPPDEDNIAQPFCRLNRGYRQARWRWTKEVTAPIIESFLTTAKPSYETVLDLDQRIRRHMLAAPFDGFVENPQSPAPFIQKNLIPMFIKIMLMYIHSSSFVEAMRVNPANPLASPYAASYLAAIIKADIKNFTLHPALFTRWWAIWKSLFNAAIIVGTVATRYPSSKIAPHAIVELFTAVDLIEKGAMSSGRAQSGLSILRRLRDKAISVYSKFSGHSLTPPPVMTADTQTDEELEIFAGYTRVLANKVLARGASVQVRQPSPHLAAGPQHDNLHPSAAHQHSSPGGSSTASSQESSRPSPATQWNQLQLQPDFFSAFSFSSSSSSDNNNNYNDKDLPWPRDFDPTIVQYFDSVDPFTSSQGGQGQGQGQMQGQMLEVPAGATYEDAGFFFTFTPNGVAAAAAAQMAFAGGPTQGELEMPLWAHDVPMAQGQGSMPVDPSLTATAMQEMQWAQFLQGL